MLKNIVLLANLQRVMALMWKWPRYKGIVVTLEVASKRLFAQVLANLQNTPPCKQRNSSFKA